MPPSTVQELDELILGQKSRPTGKSTPIRTVEDLDSRILGRQQPPSPALSNYLKDVATQVPTGIAQGLLDTIITAGLVGTYPLRRTGLFERLTGETPQETNQAIEELYSAIRPKARTELGQMFGDVAEFVAPAGGVSRIVQKPIQKLVGGEIKRRALQTGAGFAGGTAITEGGELATGQISTEQFVKNAGLSGITGALFGGIGGIPGKTMTARTARLLGEWTALTQTAPLITEQRLTTPQEALYGTILLGAFKGMEAGLSRLSARKGTSVEQEKGEIFNRTRAEGKTPSEILNEDLVKLQEEPIRPLPEEKEVLIAKPQEAQKGQEVLKPQTPPPSALGMEPQPVATESAGATPGAGIPERFRIIAQGLGQYKSAEEWINKLETTKALDPGGQVSDMTQLENLRHQGVSKQQLVDLYYLMTKPSPPPIPPGVDVKTSGAKALPRGEGVVPPLEVRGAELFGGKPPSTTADVGGYAKTEAPLKGMELPEIVELAQEINQGKYPQVKKRLRAFHGEALGVFSYSKEKKEGEIKLRADIFKDPLRAQRTLAHEIGHLVDWLPDKTLARGNILGRVATLKKHLRHFYQNLASDQYKKITEELRALSLEWKPFDPKADPRFARYRFNPKELYADAISVLVNDPALFKQKAPTFHDAFFKYLERKPEVKDVYEGIQARIRGGTEEILSAREEALIKGAERGEELLAERRPEPETLRERGRSILKELVERRWAVFRRVKEMEAKGVVIPPGKNPGYWAEEMPYINAEIGQHLTNFTTSRQRANASGIAGTDFHLYKLYRRVMTERKSLANPMGQTPETARAGMESLKKRLGDEKFKILEEAVNEHWKLRNQEVLPVLKESKTLPTELMKHLEDNENYATLSVNKYLEQSYGKGLGAKIHKQIGTLEDVANVDTATVLKDMSLIKYAGTQQYYKSVVDFQKTYRPDEYQPAKTRWNGKYQEPIDPTNPKQGLLLTMEEGKVKGHYLPKDLIDALTGEPLEAGSLIRLLQTVTSPIKDILVSKNPGFIVWNLARDLKAFAKAVPEANLLKAIWYSAKAVPDAWKEAFKGITTKDVAEMNKQRMLIRGRYWTAKDLPVDTELERLAVEFGLRPGAYRNKVIEPFARAWDWMDKPGRFAERLTKIGGYKFLKDLQAEKLKAGEHLSDKEIAHIVRKRVGSPDFLAGGHLRLLYNNIFLFSNAGVQGWRGTVESYKASPSAFAWKTVKYDFMPKLMMYGGAIGLFGPAIKKWYDDVPERDMVNYLIAPLGETSTGKTVYLVQPHDFQGQVLAGLLWKIVSATKAGDATQITNFLSGEIPYTGLNPILQTTFDWATYLRGQNPYDDFTGRYVLPQRVYEAGGPRALKEMGKHTWDTLGGSVLYRFKSDDIKGIEGELEKLLGMPIAGPFTRRFVRVSSRGVEEKLGVVAETVRQKRAEENLRAEDALVRLLNKEPLTQEDMQAIAVRPDLTKDMLLKGTAKQQGNVLLKALLSARSTEEKMAILQRYRELQK